MKMEISRQLLHLSGFLFVLLAQFTSGFLVSFYTFLVAITLFLYSEIIRREQKRLHGLVDRMEQTIRGILTKLETREVERPFVGAIWFFFSFGLIYLLFPMSPINIAATLGLILAIGDSLSTLVGLKLGKHRLAGQKTWEGSITFFVVVLLIALLFLPPPLSILTAFVATIAELIPDTKPLLRYKKRGYIDDNLLIPVITGAVLMLFV